MDIINLEESGWKNNKRRILNKIILKEYVTVNNKISIAIATCVLVFMMTKDAYRSIKYHGITGFLFLLLNPNMANMVPGNLTQIRYVYLKHFLKNQTNHPVNY